MKTNLLRILIAITIAFSYSSPAFALEFYRQEANYGNQNISVPATIGYSFYSENSSKSSDFNHAGQANTLSAFNNSPSSKQNQSDKESSIKEFFNRFLPKDNGQWFLVAMILFSMFLVSKFFLKTKKKSEPKPEEKKSLPKIA